MAKITLDVEEKNIEIVENILKNLKDGLIKNIEINQRRYVAKQKILEDEFIPKSTSKSKYLSSDEYKKKLLKK